MIERGDFFRAKVSDERTELALLREEGRVDDSSVFAFTVCSGGGGVGGRREFPEVWRYIKGEHVSRLDQAVFLWMRN